MPDVIDLSRDVLDPSAVQIVEESVWRRLCAVGVSRSGSTLIVAMGDPDDPRAIRELEVRTGLTIFPAPADEETIADALDRSYPRE